MPADMWRAVSVSDEHSCRVVSDSASEGKTTVANHTDIEMCDENSCYDGQDHLKISRLYDNGRSLPDEGCHYTAGVREDKALQQLEKGVIA